MNNYIGGEGRKAFDPASPEFAHARPKPASNVLDQIATKPTIGFDPASGPDRTNFVVLDSMPAGIRMSPTGRTITYDPEIHGFNDGQRRRMAELAQAYGMSADRLTEGARWMMTARDAITSQITRAFENFDFADIERRLMLGTNPRFASGGLVPTSEIGAEIPAMLRSEHVMSSEAYARALENDFLFGGLPRGTVTGRTSSNTRVLTSTPRRGSEMFERLHSAFSNQDTRIRSLETDRLNFTHGDTAVLVESDSPSDGTHWVRNENGWTQTLNFGGFPEAIPTFMVKGSDHNQAELELMAEILRELGVDIPEDVTRINFDHIHAAGLTRILFEEKFQFRRKMVASVPVRILRRVRRTVAGIAVVEAENRFGERILAPAPTGS